MVKLNLENGLSCRELEREVLGRRSEGGLVAMNIYDFLKQNANFKFPKVPHGSAETIGGFFSACMEKVGVFPQPKAVIGWHNLLLRYVRKDENRLLLRLYEGVTINHVLETRRGAVTRMDDGFEYAFASNYFARIIFTMAYLGYVPTDDDFEDMVNNRRVCISYPRHVNPGEQEISAYTSRMSMAEYPTAAFYTPGWYLAHIIGVKSTPFKGYEQVRIGDFILSGVVSDWVSEKGMPRRTLPHKFDDHQRKILNAHFIRFLDPINFFLVPSRNLEKHQGAVKIIGEDRSVIGYMKAQIKSAVDKIDPKVYEEFCDIALVPDEERTADGGKFGQKRLVIEFAPVPLKENKAAQAATKRKKGKSARGLDKSKFGIDEEVLLAVLYAYLVDARSYRAIENEILGLEFKARGGGFRAQSILNGFGLFADAKGILSSPEADAFVENCGDPLRILLMKMLCRVDNTRS